jgi:hypothetical protein
MMLHLQATEDDVALSMPFITDGKVIFIHAGSVNVAAVINCTAFQVEQLASLDRSEF